jgi:hypothetical protein
MEAYANQVTDCLFEKGNPKPGLAQVRFAGAIFCSAQSVGDAENRQPRRLKQSADERPSFHFLVLRW